jgi:PBSX family phage portal protein
MQKDGVKRFRRYVQIGANGKRVYFKEFGDPRSIDPNTGKVDPSLPIEQQATEIWEEEIYSPGSGYGQPRWIGALPDMLGIRESEIVNLNFFRENAIPAMAVLISGGALTEESYDKVVNVINAARGQDAMNRILILEAAADDSVGDADKAPPAPRIDLKPMVNERQQDGLFKEYQLAAKRKIRSTMRLPAIYTGDTEEYTKATAQTGLRIAEGQVFTPERSKFDDFINYRILPALGITNWWFRTLGPSVYDPDTLSVMIDRFGRQGAMTPNILIKIANQVLDVQIPPVKEDWGNIPFTYTMGMVAQGAQLQGFEELFATIQEAALPADPNADPNAPPSANDNKPGNAAARKIKGELVALTDDLINRINEAAAERMNALAEAA